MADTPLQNLIRTLSKFPGLGPRSAQRGVLYLLKNDGSALSQLLNDLVCVKQAVQRCKNCGNLDHQNPCSICMDVKRDATQLCIVENVSDLWAIEHARFFKGHYHVLGGSLSAIDGVGPAQLNTSTLVNRIHTEKITEVIIALSATIEGQTTTYYISDLLASLDIKMYSLAQGVPFGGELNYLDEGTLSAAFLDKRSISKNSNPYAA